MRPVGLGGLMSRLETSVGLEKQQVDTVMCKGLDQMVSLRDAILAQGPLGSGSFPPRDPNPSRGAVFRGVF